MKMKQDAKKLLPGTVIKNSIGERGKLVAMRHGITGKQYWLVDWPVRGLTPETIEYIQSCELC